MLYVTGFNGFQQFNYMFNDILENEFFFSKFLEGEEESSCLDLHTTWSNMLIIKVNSVTISGFLNGKPGETLKLETPDEQPIIQGNCNKNKCLFVTNQGKCWQYILNSNEWKEINYCTVPDQYSYIVKIALGEIINAALTKDGKVWNLGNQLSPPGMKVINIDCGKEHGILLNEAGDVFTWGGGSRGQLGNGTLDSTEEICEVPLLAGMKVEKIAAGGWHNAVITQDGDVYTWGWNKQGQLGHPILNGSDEGVSVLTHPKVVDWPNSMEVFVKQISCGASHTVTLLANGEIWGCGWNKWGQLGTTKFQFTHLMTKLEITPSVSIKKIICDAWNTVIISEDSKSEFMKHLLIENEKPNVKH